MLPLIFHRQARLQLLVLLFLKNYLMHVRNAFFRHSNLILDRINLAALESRCLVLARNFFIELLDLFNQVIAQGLMLNLAIFRAYDWFLVFFTSEVLERSEGHFLTSLLLYGLARNVSPLARGLWI